MLSPSDLYDWQKRTAREMARRRQCALFADPGDGKTITTLSALSRCRIEKPILIVAPSTICKEKIWPKEAANWSHTCGATFITLQGMSPAKREAAVVDSSARAYVISYASLPSLIDFLRKKRKKLGDIYGAIVFDELQSLKTPGSKRFRKLRSQVTGVPIRFGLTGSPTGNSILGLWSEMFAVAGADPLGPRFTDYREQYFESDYMGYNWYPRENAEELICHRIKPYALYTINPRGTDQSERVSIREIVAPVPKRLHEEYDRLAEDFQAELGDDFVWSENAGILASKLKQFESGAIYKNIELGTEPSGEWLRLHDDRVEATRRLVDSLNGQPLLIFYEYDHERQRLLEALPNAEHISEPRAVDRWNGNEIPQLLAHPRSAGHGLNLHLGGAYNMLFFATPWSLEQWEQAIGRLDRSGQKRRVNVFRFSGCPVGDRAYHRLVNHDKTQKSIKAAVSF